MAETAALLNWRKKQKRGEIMEPAKFESLVRQAMAKYHISRQRAERVAGKIYWKTAESKFRNREGEMSKTAEAIHKNMKKRGK